MIPLNRGCFKPWAIFLSVIFIPIISLCFFCLLDGYRTEILVAFFISIFIYFAGLLIAHRYSVSKKYFLNICDDIFEIHGPKILDNETMCRVYISDIVNIEYSRISSILSWINLLHTAVLPQSVFITFRCDGKEVCKLMGYMSYTEIRNLCDRFNIKLIAFD